MLQKRIYNSPDAPAPIGPYSQAVGIGDLVFCSGQIPLPDKLEASISDQTHQVLKNLEAVLHQATCSFNDIVKVTIFLIDMKDFQAVNEVYGKYFTAQFPARSTIAVAGLPRGARVEIEAIAVKKHSV